MYADSEVDAERAAKQRARQSAEERYVSALRAVMETKPGRAVIWKMLQRANIYSTTFRESHAESAFLEGARNLGLMLLADMKGVDPELYNLMVKEHSDER